MWVRDDELTVIRIAGLGGEVYVVEEPLYDILKMIEGESVRKSDKMTPIEIARMISPEYFEEEGMI